MSKQWAVLFIVSIFAAGSFSHAQEGQNGSDEDRIKAAIQSYVTAFNQRNAAQLVEHWSPQGVYVSRSSGEQITGKEALTEEFSSMFANDSAPQLAVVTDSIEFISPNVALERGTATVTFAPDDVVETAYRVVYVKHGDNWLIDRVTEDVITEEASNYEKLKGLEWLIGEWVDQSEESRIEFSSRWTKNQNFIARKYAAYQGVEVTSAGLQIIGWDPKQETIRSWLFDSSGSVVEGIWNQRDDRWVVTSTGTLADGASGSFTSVFRPLEDGSYAWQKINRIVDGQLLPQLEETIVRPQSVQ